MFEFISDDTGAALTVKLAGRMDSAHCLELAPAVEKQLAAPHKDLKVVFDMAGVTFMASAFFRVCMSTARRLAPGNFSVINASPEARRGFQFVELDYFFKIS